MANLFLHNESIDIPFDLFLAGMSELNAIEREEGDVFLKHESVYNLANYATLCSNYGQVEGFIIKFLGQMTVCDTYIDSEPNANDYCKVKKNAFLGIDFLSTSIPILKQVYNQESYKKWIYNFADDLDDFGRLKLILCNESKDCVFESDFKKEFNSYGKDVRKSVLDLFTKAKNRDYFNFPDNTMVKDVSNGKVPRLLELRVFNPVAVRVYFCIAEGVVYVAKIAKKSSTQSNDINTAFDTAEALIKKS